MSGPVNFPTYATLAARTRAGSAFTGVATNAYGLITTGGTALFGAAPGASSRLTIPVIIGKRRYALPVGPYTT
jgi:hypothetical protein